MPQYTIGYLPGDGIGPEVAAQARLVLNTAARKFGFQLDWVDFPFGADYYLRTNEVLPVSALSELADCQALLLGAIGDPRVKPGILEQQLLLALRFHFDQYLNLRPAQSFPNLPLPVKLPEGQNLDAVVIRENTEDMYMNLGGRGRGRFQAGLAAKRGLYDLKGRLEVDFGAPVEAALQVAVASRPAVERIARVAFETAKRKNISRVTLVSKANAAPHLYGFWDETTKELAAREYPEMRLEIINVDAMCYHLLRRPLDFRVILAPNLFGDIISDLLAALTGGLGLAASGNIGDTLSMFEPVHGSAPDIAGSGRANPLAAILSASLLLDRLGEEQAALAINVAVSTYLTQKPLADWPIELAGQAGVEAVGKTITQLIKG